MGPYDRLFDRDGDGRSKRRILLEGGITIDDPKALYGDR